MRKSELNFIQRTLTKPEFLAGFSATLSGINSATSATELSEILNEVNEDFGLAASVFACFTREDETMDSYRHVIACPSAWCNQYNAKRWFAIDPCLIYAQHNSEPILVENISVRTAGQKALMQAARDFGFKSGAIFPAHSAGGRMRMGVLYVAGREEDAFDEGTLEECKHVFRSISAEMLDWWMRKIREEILTKVRLNEVELRLLMLEREGFSTKEIALQTGMQATAIDARFRRIMLRFGESSRKVVAQKAFDMGILRDTL
jgi:Autoinducer binding domain